MSFPGAIGRAEFAALYDEHVGVVRSVLLRLCPGGRLDDLTQEVFLRAWRGQSSFRRQSSAKTWLCRIARNLAIDELRAVRPEPLPVDHDAAAPGIDPGERALVLELLGRMEPDDRLLLVLLCVEQCSIAEIAEVLEVPAGTVKSRAFTLRQKLKQELTRKEAVHG
ncbi:MAG TPA: sigma-70 family RNA polymerase sigma factor [Myxococcales bacterium]|nr:sigma-70 family RNA polymerase sigma factor [Myxococcales bacterium]